MSSTGARLRDRTTGARQHGNDDVDDHTTASNTPHADIEEQPRTADRERKFIETHAEAGNSYFITEEVRFTACDDGRGVLLAESSSRRRGRAGARAAPRQNPQADSPAAPMPSNGGWLRSSSRRRLRDLATRP